MPLSQAEYEILNFIEQEYMLSRHLPTVEVISEKTGIPADRIRKLWEREDFKTAVRVRGVDTRVSPTGILTAEQLMLANTLLDFSDTRSHKKKLQDLGISSQTYQGWLRDPAFQGYMVQRAENLLPDVTAEAHLALVDNVRRGDLGSIKLYYEMTGRWSSKTVGELNVEFLLMKVLEAVQKHVSDPKILENISDELMALAPQAPANRNALPAPAATVPWTL